MSRRSNQWFVPGEGIAREVITADIQRYLGPDALVRPGMGNAENEGVSGYWITAYRTLTTQMIADLKLDSQRWRAEAGRVAYQDSRTHASRQHYGPSANTAPVEYPQSQSQSQEPPRQSYQGYPPSEPSYTHAPQSTGGYSTQQSAYSSYQPPRTTQPAPYYSQQAPRETHSSYSQPQEPAPYYYSQPTSEPPRQPSYPTQAQSVRPGYYLASDGNQYPYPPAQQPQSNTGRRRN